MKFKIFLLLLIDLVVQRKSVDINAFIEIEKTQSALWTNY